MRILITSGRAPASLELIRLLKLGGHEVHVADSLPVHLSQRSKGVFKNHLVPPPRQHPQEYGAALEQIIIAHKIELLIPTFEETFWVAHFKQRLEKHCRVFVDNLNKLKSLHNKATFIQQCETIGLPTPESHEVYSQEEIAHWAKTLKQFVLKPTYSRFGEEVLINPNASQILALDISPDKPWVIQEFLEGKAFCSYALCQNGEVLASAIYPSEIKSNKVSLNFRHIEHQKIHDWVAFFAKKLNFTGQLSFDFIETQRNLYAIECNPRMTSGLHLFEGREDFHLIFKNPTQLLKPHHHVKNMMGVLVLLYGFSDLKNLFSNLKIFFTSRDIIFRRDDIKPFFDQFKAFIWLSKESRKRSISLSKLTTADIEWNGESV